MKPTRANFIENLLILWIAVSLIYTTLALNCNDPKDYCMNGGVCEASTGFCECSVNWFGPNCNVSCESKCPTQQNLICVKDSNTRTEDNDVTACTCKGGYKPNDNYDITKGCRKDYCGRPSFNCNGNGECNDTTGEYRCDCNEGYNGPECEFNCLEMCNNHTNTHCDYDGFCYCKDGFKPNSNNFPEENGCFEDYCDRIGFDCNHHGTCHGTTGDYSRCDCYEGYNGPDCEFNCLEICNNHTNTHCDYDGFCYCKDGFKPNSTWAEENGCFEDLCSKAECHNNAQCVNHDGYAYCKCTASNYGPRCNNTCADYCKFDDNLMCSNGNTEYYDKTNNIPQCVCKDDQHIPINDINILDGCNIDLCKNLNPCDRSTKCERISNADYHCICDAGFFGKNCTDLCSSMCNEPNEKCVPDEQNFNNDVTCDCADGYEGKDCEISCEKECGTNSNCNRTAYNVICSCKKNYLDRPKSDNKTNCVKDICAEKVCQNAAGCKVASDGSYSCVCRPDFTGKNCENKVYSNTVLFRIKATIDIVLQKISP